MEKTVDFSKIYSPSRLLMFDVCPKQYHFYYKDPIYSKMKNELKKKPENIWSFYTLGKAVHNAITLFYHLPLAQRTKEALRGFLKETWQAEAMLSKKPPLGKWGGFESLEEERRAYAEALLMLDNFYKIAEHEPKIEYLPTGDFCRSIDDYVNLAVPLSPDWDISGKFDLVTSEELGLHIIDFKTGKKEKDDPFQLRFYKVLAEDNFQKSVKKASFYFLRSGNKVEFDLEKEDSERIKEELLEKIEKIEKTENFETKPGKLCKFCLFKNFCPEKSRVEEIVEKEKIDFSEDLPF